MDCEHDGAIVVEPARDLVVLDAVDDASNLIEIHRHAVAIGDHDLAILRGLGHCSGSSECHALLGSVKRAHRGIGVGLGDDGADVFERNVARCRGHRIDLDTYRKFLRAVDQNLGDAGELRNLLRQRDLAVFVHDRERLGLGVETDIENGKVAWIDLPEARRNRHLNRQPSRRHRQCSLHIQRSAVDIAVEIELDRDGRDAQR